MTGFLTDEEGRRLGVGPAKPNGLGPRRFGSKLEALGSAVHIWHCRRCSSPAIEAEHHNRAPSTCRVCGGDLIHFPSRIEHQRACTLLMYEKVGKIEQLRFHPRFDLDINGRRWRRYEADSIYVERDTRKTVVEEVKPQGFMTDVAKMKIDAFNLIYGPKLTVTIFRG